MRSYYNPATKLRKGEKPLTALERLQKSMSSIDLSGLSVAAERIGKSLAAVGEKIKEVKVPEIERNEENQIFGGFENDQEDL